MTRFSKENVGMGILNGADKTLKGTYKAGQYKTYHAYRRAEKRANWIAGIAVLSLFVLPLVLFQVFAIDVAIILMTIYMLYIVNISYRSGQIKADSKAALNQIAANYRKKVKIKGWNIYDGVYDEDGESIEISFFKERSFINNVYRLIRGNSYTVPLEQDDFDVLKFFVEQQQKSNAFVVYTTMPLAVKNDFEKRGFELTEINNRYRNKPGRWDYAAATGFLVNALWHYPKTFKAYTLKVADLQK